MRAVVTGAIATYPVGGAAWDYGQYALGLEHLGWSVVLQDTGFSDHLPTSDGLLAFSDLDGAARSIEAVEADYAHHQEAARELARTHVDSDAVLTEMLDCVGLG